MDYQTIVFLLEGYLASEGNTTEGALRYIRELENKMAKEMFEDEMEIKEIEDEINLNEINYYAELDEREEEKSRNFWIPLTYGDHEYALVNRNEDGSLNYKDYHTT